jgi:cysteine desulfurase/selenocysteine lyase
MVPWQMAARDAGAAVKYIPVSDDQTLDMAAAKKLFTSRTRLVSVALMANATGTIHAIAELAALARKAGALVVLDGAQGVPHMKTDVATLDCDFLAFSAHKMLGPTGVGVLYGKKELLDAMEPFMGGGEMIREVKLEGSTWNAAPWKFEAGTPNIADVSAFAAALDYLGALGMDAVREHEKEITAYALEKLRALGGLTLYGPDDMEKRGGVVSFTDEFIHPHDMSTLLDRCGVAVRAGHHCAQPLMRRLGVVATTRASFYISNDRDDVDALAGGIREARKYFGFS